MNAILDASSAINLVNGGVLTTVLRIRDCEFAVGPQVLEECHDQQGELADAVERGQLTVLDDDVISGSAFAALLVEHQLGLGETECLAFAQLDSELAFCSDDKRARAVARTVLGESRVIGSIYLLKECVRQRLLSGTEANGAYAEMRAQGGFLPSLPSDYFDTI